MPANPDDKLTMAMDVRVKALVWSQPKAGMALLKGDGAIRYTVAQVGYQWGWKPEWGAGTVVDSEFSAKAAAQADYTARILSAIEPSPSAEREATRQIVCEEWQAFARVKGVSAEAMIAAILNRIDGLAALTNHSTQGDGK